MREHILKRHNKNLLLYHIVCPAKYRRKVFTESVEQTLKKTCEELGRVYELWVVELGSDEDHVHFLVQTVPMILPSRMVQTIKSITAKQIFNHHPEVKQMLWGGKFWTSGYYINTVGRYGNESVISNYVKNQGKTYKPVFRQQPTLFEGLE